MIKAFELDENWSTVLNITKDQVVENYRDKQMADAYRCMLDELRGDREVDGMILLGMRRAPGSKERHHPMEGGLVKHLLQMWGIWSTLKHTIRQSSGGTWHEQLSDQNVWRAILHHDLNKVWRYKVLPAQIRCTCGDQTASTCSVHGIDRGNTSPADEWKVDYAQDADRHQAYLTKDMKTLFFLQKHGISISLPLFNALFTAEGGFSRLYPEKETVLAKVVYILDELSAGVVDRLLAGTFWDSKVGGVRETP